MDSMRPALAVKIQAKIPPRLGSLGGILLLVWALSVPRPTEAAWPQPHHDSYNQRHVPGPGALAEVPGIHWSQSLGGTALTPRARLVDLNEDGEPEIVVPGLGRVWVYGLDGSTVGRGPILGITDIVDDVDIDGDGQRDLLTTSGKPGSGLWILDGQSFALRWQLKPNPQSEAFSGDELIVANVDASAGIEIVVSSDGPGTPDISLLKPISGFDGSVIVQNDFGTDVQKVWVMGQFLEDGHQQIVIPLGEDLQIVDASASAAGNSIVYTVYEEIFGSGFGTGSHQVVDIDLDGTDEVLFTGHSALLGQPVGVVVVSLTDPAGDWVQWGCQWSYEIDELASTAAISQQLGRPADLDGDDRPDFAIAYRDGCPTLLFDAKGTCPISPHIPALSPAGDCDPAVKTGAYRMVIVDLSDGTEKASWDNATPLGPIDVDGDGIAELLVRNHDDDGVELGVQVLRLQGGVLESVATLPVDWSPRLIEAFPHYNDRSGTEMLITRTMETGATELLVHNGLFLYGWARFNDTEFLEVLEPALSNPACGALRAAFPATENPTHLLFDGNGTRLCVSDGEFNFSTEIPAIPVERSLSFLAADMDSSAGGSIHPSEEILINQTLYEWSPAEELQSRAGYQGVARFIRAADDGSDAELITMIGSTIRGYGPDGVINWSTGLPAEHETFSFADIRSGRFFSADDPRGLFVLMEESIGLKRRRGSLLKTDPAPTFTGPLDLHREDGDIWSYSQHAILLPLDVDGPDSIESLLVRVKGGQTYLLSEADFLASGLATPLEYGVTMPGTIAARAELNGDLDPEFVLSFESSNSGLSQKASYDVQSTGIVPHSLPPGDENPCIEELIDLGDSPARLCRWRKLVGENAFRQSTNARNFALLDVDEDGRDEFAFVDGNGRLHLLAASTGLLLEGYPVALTGGELRVEPDAIIGPIRSLAAVDISGDGATDLVAGTADGWIYALSFDPTNAPLLLWSLYLGVPVHQISPVDWNGDGNLELVASLDNGELLGLGSTTLQVDILEPDPDTEFILPDISLGGTASGADLVTVRVGGEVVVQTAVVDGQWSAPMSLPAGTSDIEVEVLSGTQKALSNLLLTYHPDLDLDGVDNVDDCFAEEGYLDPTVYPEAPEECDGRDNNCDGVFLPDGTACDDEDVCTSDDMCNSEICQGSIITGLCDDGNSCTTDSCDPLASCVHVFNHLNCNDADACTTDDVCSLGICAGVDTSDVDCDDGNICTTDGCEPNSGCQHSPSELPCDDGDLATYDDSCNLLNNCEGIPYECVPTACELSSTPNGVDCTAVYVPQGTLCDDDDAATKNDLCDVTGVCAGTPFECPEGPCIESNVPNGIGCDTVYLPIGTECDDGQLNTRADGCNPLGDCIGLPYECVAGPCDASSLPNGEDCDVVELELGAPCEDNDPNTKEDSCDEAGLCVGIPYSCEPGTCEIESVADGIGCFPIYAMPGTSCDDGEFLTKNDTCDGMGGCAGVPYTCEPNDCQISSSPNGNGCDIVPREEGLVCDDASLTSHTDQCDGEGNCVGIAYECIAGQCEASSIANGVDCDVVFKIPGTSCVDDNPASHSDICDDAGVCSGIPFSCEPGPCVVSSIPNGVDCDMLYHPSGTPCDDDNLSTHTDVCDGVGACVGFPFTCPTSACVPESTPNGVYCDEAFAAQGTPCDDDQLNTKDDLCDGIGLCSGAGYTCNATDCQQSSEVNGVDCTVVDKSDGTACDDLNNCTVNDICDLGQCAPGLPVDCDDLIGCTLDDCDPDTGCVHDPDASQCDDGLPCTDESCDLLLGCVPTADDSQCDDTNPCTLDRCDLQSGCQSTSSELEGEACGPDRICVLGVCTDQTVDSTDGDTSNGSLDTVGTETSPTETGSSPDGSFDSDDIPSVEDTGPPGPGCGCSTASRTPMPAGTFLLGLYALGLFITRRKPWLE